jgi:hypothetical protein
VLKIHESPILTLQPVSHRGPTQSPRGSIASKKLSRKEKRTEGVLMVTLKLKRRRTSFHFILRYIQLPFFPRMLCQHESFMTCLALSLTQYLPNTLPRLRSNGLTGQKAIPKTEPAKWVFNEKLDRCMALSCLFTMNREHRPLEIQSVRGKMPSPRSESDVGSSI